MLLVDADPQGDLTSRSGWGDPDALEVTLANHLSAVIEGEGIESREGILSHKEGIDLMPANIELAGMEMPILMAMSREQLMNVWLAPLKADYDFILIDCAPTLGIIPVNAFVAADGVLVPGVGRVSSCIRHDGALEDRRAREAPDQPLAFRRGHPHHSFRQPATTWAREVEPDHP